MEKITIRNYRFEGKENDYSKTEDFRILTTEKCVNDAILEFAEFDENTTFLIHSGDNVVEITAEKYRNLQNDLNSGKSLNDNDLNLLAKLYLLGMRKISKYSITEEIYKTLKNAEKDSENIVKNRIVEIF